MFLHSFDTSTINNLDKSYHFFVWPFWLLFCLFVTLFLVVFLALSSPNHANPNPSTSGYSGGTGISPATPVVIAWAHLAVNVVPSLKDKARQITFWVYIAAFCLWGLFIYSKSLSVSNGELIQIHRQVLKCKRELIAYSLVRTVSAVWVRYVTINSNVCV